MDLFLKLAGLILALTVTAAVLLGFRQQRIRLAHELVVEHRQVEGSRREIWDMQQRIAGQTHPRVLQAEIEAAGLELEPVHPVAPVVPAAGADAFMEAAPRRELRP